MKALTKQQADVAISIDKMSIEIIDDEDSRIALIHAATAYRNYIQFGVGVESIYGNEMEHDLK